VTTGGAAERAGLRGLSKDNSGEIVLGDIILTLDGEAINDTDDLYRFLDKKQIGDTVQAEIFRNGKKTTVPIKLLSPPQNRPSRRT
jgi:S1-C subfamily serine protease